MVTLGIIGVVSAMTVPTLVKNHQRQVYVTQLQKVVNELTQAAERAITDNNAVSLSETEYRDPQDAKLLTRYLKVTKNCSTNRDKCFASEYKTLTGEVFSGWYCGGNYSASVILASGASVCISRSMTDGRYLDGSIRHGNSILYMDVNGLQGPNILGRDLFYAELYSDGVVGESHSGDLSQADWCLNNGMGYGVGCFSKIVSDGWKMDY